MTAPSNIELATLSGDYTGAAASVYPNLAFVAKQQWSWPVWITKIEFSTSLTIYPTDLGGMLVTLGKQSQNGLAVDPGLKSVVVHVTAPNSIAGPPAFALPSSKVSPISFDGCGYFLDAETPVSLYAFANTTASGNYLIGIASIQYRRVRKTD